MPARINPDLAKGEQCRRSLFKFVQEFWEEIIPEDPVWNWHIEYLCDEIQRDVLRVCKLPEQRVQGFVLPAKLREPKLHDVLVNIPPGTTKSTILSVMLPAWAWTVDATLRIISASYSGELSMGLAVKSRDIIQSDKYRAYFPKVRIREDSNNKGHYINTEGGERFTTSTGSTILGIHGHLIIIDDPVNTKEAASEGALEQACDFVNSTLAMRKVDKKITLTVMVMQRLHEKDPSGSWLSMEGYKIKHICLPARLDEDGEVVPAQLKENYVDGFLDPVRLDAEALSEALMKLGTYGYAGQMGQNPTPKGGGVWQQWFVPVADKDMPLPDQMEGYGTDWDTAYTQVVTNASSAAVVSGRIGNIMYIDRIAWFNQEFPQLINTIMHGFPFPHYVEAKASGKSVKQVLVNAGHPAEEVQVAGDKLVRARTATPIAERKQVYVRASILDKLYNDKDQGILKFPKAPKQDLADTIAQAICRHLAKPARKFKVGW
jgi:phage terminase large subunit-like protein